MNVYSFFGISSDVEVVRLRLRLCNSRLCNSRLCEFCVSNDDVTTRKQFKLTERHTRVEIYPKSVLSESCCAFLQLVAE